MKNIDKKLNTEILSKLINDLKKIKSEFIQAKLILKQKEDELDKRERYLRNKFQDAGIKY